MSTDSEMRPPLVSVVTRTYNRPERLADSLASQARQRFKDFEVVVVNDAGEDVQSVIDRFPELRVNYIVHEFNQGRTAALNTGVANAQGQYVAFVDDDDVIYAEHLETLVSDAKSTGYPVVYGDVLNVTYKKDANGVFKRVHEQLVYSFDFERDNFLLANYIPINCLLIAKACLDDVGEFDETLLVYEDWDMLIRLSRKYDFHHVAKQIGEYRRRDDNSNILEQDRYTTNEVIIKERYKDERNAIFDGIFKQTFQLKRDIRHRDQQLQQAIQHIRTLEAQVQEARATLQRLQQQVGKGDAE